MELKKVLAKGLAIVVPAIVVFLLMLYAALCLVLFVGKWFFYAMLFSALPVSIIVGGYVAEKIFQKELGKRKGG